MKNLKKMFSILLSLCVFAQATPVFANMDSTISKKAMTEKAMAATIGGSGSLDAQISNDYKPGTTAISAVVANRGLLNATYTMESMDIYGANVITIATGEITQGQVKIITGTIPVERRTGYWSVRVRATTGVFTELMAQDVATYDLYAN